MRKLFLATVCILALGLVACGGKNTTAATGPVQAATVTMEASTFTASSVTLKVGGTLTLTDDKTNGATHILVLGQNGTYVSSPNGPAALNDPNGVTFTQGDSHTYTFATAGTYMITCTIHPTMNLTVTVVS